MSDPFAEEERSGMSKIATSGATRVRDSNSARENVKIANAIRLLPISCSRRACSCRHLAFVQRPDSSVIISGRTSSNGRMLRLMESIYRVAQIICARRMHRARRRYFLFRKRVILTHHPSRHLDGRDSRLIRRHQTIPV